VIIINSKYKTEYEHLIFFRFIKVNMIRSICISYVHYRICLYSVYWLALLFAFICVNLLILCVCMCRILWC